VRRHFPVVWAALAIEFLADELALLVRFEQRSFD
jgi:hypothetical protein